MLRSLRWDGDALVLVDQTALPAEERYLRCRTAGEVADAIRSLKVRGAPAIGAAAAYALALAARSAAPDGSAPQRAVLRRAAQELLATRPTAVNLRWAVERVLAVVDTLPDAPPEAVAEAVLREAHAIAAADVASNRALAAYGAALIRPGERILTYCNTGSLATVDVGTALGILRVAHEQGKGIHVYVCETRPVLQGARLTTVEVMRAGIPATLITDNAAGWLMRTGRVDRVVVGADRIARNGDTANKIGTYTLAVLARAHEIPFIVAAPLSTVDFRAPDGDAIPVEERRPEEITHVAGVAVAPAGMPALNIAFDITPHHLISAIVTDAGVATPPYVRSLQELASPRPRQ
jgi:methylthioribose-1-phosphate isomerase